MSLQTRSSASWVLAALVAGGLGYDAYVHCHLASTYDAIGSTITQGALFRVEAAAAVVSGLLVVLSNARWAWALAGLVGLGGVLAVVLYRYVDVPSIGPIPSMYEPVWYAEKARSAVAEGAVVLLCLLHGLAGPRRSAG